MRSLTKNVISFLILLHWKDSRTLKSWNIFSKKENISQNVQKLNIIWCHRHVSFACVQPEHFKDFRQKIIKKKKNHSVPLYTRSLICFWDPFSKKAGTSHMMINSNDLQMLQFCMN